MWALVGLALAMLIIGALARFLDYTRRQAIQRGSRIEGEPVRYRTQETHDNSWLDSVRANTDQSSGPTRAEELASKTHKPKAKQEDYDDFFETDDEFFENDDAFAEFDDLFKDD